MRLLRAFYPVALREVERWAPLSAPIVALAAHRCELDRRGRPAPHQHQREPDQQGAGKIGRAEHLVIGQPADRARDGRSEEHTSELQSLMRISYAVFCLKKKKTQQTHKDEQYTNTHAEHKNNNTTTT